MSTYSLWVSFKLVVDKKKKCSPFVLLLFGNVCKSTPLIAKCQFTVFTGACFSLENLGRLRTSSCSPRCNAHDGHNHSTTSWGYAMIFFFFWPVSHSSSSVKDVQMFLITLLPFHCVCVCVRLTSEVSLELLQDRLGIETRLQAWPAPFTAHEFAKS